jgi:hypothetical protein
MRILPHERPGNKGFQQSAQSAFKSPWQASADAAERRSISRIEASKKARRDPDALERSAKSAFDQGKLAHKPNAPPGNVWLAWETNQHKKVLRLIEQTKQKPTCACEMCGAQFVPKRSDAKTCGSACRQKAYRIRSAEARA